MLVVTGNWSDQLMERVMHVNDLIASVLYWHGNCKCAVEVYQLLYSFDLPVYHDMAFSYMVPLQCRGIGTCLGFGG